MPNSDSVIERQSGFYWVRTNIRIEVAYWSHCYQSWETAGTDCVTYDEHVTVLSERLKEPDASAARTG